MRLAGYTRVSRVGARENLISPELQEKRIISFAEFRGWEVEMFPPELDVSGGRSSRPVLDSIINGIRAGQFDGIIVAQIDRLSRMEMTSALAVIEKIEQAGGRVVAVAENVDPTTPEGRMARNMFLSLAAMQRERYAGTLAEAKERAVRLGIWPVSRVPFGYSKDSERKLCPNKDAPTVVKAFECRAAGGTLRDVGEILGTGPNVARKLIHNRVYLGEINVGEWHNPAAHPPIVDRSLFESAQITHPAPRRVEDAGALLRGRVRCAGCQRRMSFHNNYYRCRGYPHCDVRAGVAVKKLDAIAERLVLELAGRAGVQAVEPDDSLKDLEEAEAELLAYQRSASAAGDEEMFADGLRQRAAAVKEARARVTTVRAELPLAIVADEWPDLSLDDRRHVLGGLIGVVWVWAPDRFRFIAAGSEPAGLSQPGAKGPEPVLLKDTDLPGEIRMPPPEDVN